MSGGTGSVDVVGDLLKRDEFRNLLTEVVREIVREHAAQNFDARTRAIALDVIGQFEEAKGQISRKGRRSFNGG
jgi:hypothetical protein